MGICKSKTSKGKFHSIFDNKKNEENQKHVLKTLQEGSNDLNPFRNPIIIRRQNFYGSMKTTLAGSNA